MHSSTGARRVGGQQPRAGTSQHFSFLPSLALRRRKTLQERVMCRLTPSGRSARLITSSLWQHGPAARVQSQSPCTKLPSSPPAKPMFVSRTSSVRKTLPDQTSVCCACWACRSRTFCAASEWPLSQVCACTFPRCSGGRNENIDTGTS